MNLNRIKDGHCVALHHEAGFRTHTPQSDCGCREPVVYSCFAAYSGARAYVVQREIAERVNDLASQRHRNDERSAVDYRPCRRSCEVACVAHCTSNIGEQRGAGVYVRRDWTASGSSQSSHKVCEGSDVFVVCVFRIGDCVKRSGGSTENVVLRRQQAAGYAHLVEISIRRERKEAGVLGFVSKAASAIVTRSLKHRHGPQLTTLGKRLSIYIRNQVIAVYGLDKAIPKHGSRRSEFVEGKTSVYVFLG